jgi:hypothetical protein
MNDKKADKIAIGWRGKKLNAKTILMLQSAERRLGRRLELFQGSFNPGGVDASAHTHDLGGVLDIKGNDTKVVRVLRKVGFAAFPRTVEQFGVSHIHAVSIFDTDLHPEAAAQVQDYKRGGNGLSGKSHGPDTGPKVTSPREPELVKQAVHRREILFNQTNDSIAFLQDRLGATPDGFFGPVTQAATKRRFGWDGVTPLGEKKFLKFFPASVFIADAALTGTPVPHLAGLGAG